MSGPATNDLLRLVPRTDFPSARALEFDFPGLEIGIAEYEEGPTGCTVFHFPKTASLAIDVRGSRPLAVASERRPIRHDAAIAGEQWQFLADAKARDATVQVLDIAEVVAERLA